MIITMMMMVDDDGVWPQFPSIMEMIVKWQRTNPQTLIRNTFYATNECKFKQKRHTHVSYHKLVI